MFLEVNISKYNPLRASSYIPLPKALQYKKAVVNVQNEDEFCFAWALVSAVVEPQGPPHRMQSYPNFRGIFNFEGIDFPVKLHDISKFEAQNPVSINVYGVEKLFENGKMKYEIVGPLHFSNNKKHAHINLLLISDSEGNSHYCWIKNFSRLLAGQVTAKKCAKHFCDGCLRYFQTKEQLWQHTRFDCNHVYTKLPNTDPVKDASGKTIAGNILKFENYNKQLKVPFVVYADFESILKPIDTVEPNPQKKFTIKTCEHEPHSFAYYIKCSYDDKLSKFQTYRGPDAAAIFMQNLETDVRNLYKDHLKHIKPMFAMSQQQIQNFETASFCHICEQPFETEDVKVRDHYHLTGIFRGAAHEVCNLNYNVPNFIPIFFHNLTGYDSHLFIKQLALEQEKIDVIAQNKEKYVSFTKHILVDEIIDRAGKPQKVFLRMRFLDSIRFLNSSLDTLSQNLTSDQCVEIKKHFGNDLKFEIMKQKGVFPYSYVDSFDRLEEKRLPTYEDFYDKLRGEHISKSDYKRAVDVWNLFKCKTLGDYSDIYLKTDVLLLADVFENFRTVCMKHYALDPAQYFTAPGLSWDAMLKSTSVQLELLTDIDMVHFFKKGIRGGVSTCVGRKSFANNKFLPNYDPSQPNSFIMYLDATNLYGHSMSQYLPQRDFAWLNKEEIDHFNVNSVSDESDLGYVLEVDLIYPENLHDEHNDLPFCPESMVPPTARSKFKKLIPNLNNKLRYVIHYRNLKQCLAHGLHLNKIHRILKFKQAPWLKSYIDLNTRLRNAADNESDKNLFKLMNNSIYGKTMENVDNRVDVKLLSHWETIGRKFGAEIFVAKPNFKNLAIFSENLVAIQMEKQSIMYDKPVYVGFSILDVSKICIYEFYYDYLKRLYGNQVSLLYTDTDSLILEIYTDNFYNDMKNNLDRFDTSKYKPGNRHNIPRNESVIGKMKDEYSGEPILSFFGAGAKSYCVNVGDRCEKKAKGVTRNVIKKDLRAADYETVAGAENAVIFCKMLMFRSHLHNMYTEMRNKVALSSTDDKRYLIPGTTKTLAWGHRDISITDHDENLDLLVELLQAAC